MHPFAEFLRNHEMWLMRRIRDYAVARDYSRYTSTLEEAWRISIVGLTDSVISALAISEEPWELSPDDNFVDDPIAAFGVEEARNHRSRGVTLEMFMGLMKYYRQAFLDLIKGPETPLNKKERDWRSYACFVERVFDRIEIAFCAEWCRDETVAHAIDELQEANRLMTNEKNKFLTIFESLPIAVFFLDDNRYIQHMNHAAAQMIDCGATSGGYYYAPSEGRPAFPWLADELSRFCRDDEKKERECRITLPDGNERRVLAFFRPMKDISLKYAGMVVILKDITERKTAEEELIQARDFLMQQEKMASIGQLAAGVAHEINNPMSFIMSNLSTLKGYIDNLTEFICRIPEQVSLDEIREDLEIDFIVQDAGDLLAESLDGAERVKGIVQDLRAFSRVGQADYTLINLNESMETTLNIARNELKYVADLELDLGDIPKIECYPQQLNQVFLNLLINAAHAIDGRGTITVRSRCEDGTVRISVSDTGCGIAEENVSRIFDPFFTTKDVGKGTGLGLSISYGIVKNHGGEIEVESEPGKGSTFTIVLPTKKERP